MFVFKVTTSSVRWTHCKLVRTGSNGDFSYLSVFCRLYITHIIIKITEQLKQCKILYINVILIFCCIYLSRFCCCFSWKHVPSTFYRVGLSSVSCRHCPWLNVLKTCFQVNKKNSCNYKKILICNNKTVSVKNKTFYFI